MEDVEIVVAHKARATLRVGDTFLKVDSDQVQANVEVDAMSLAPVPTPPIRWHRPPVLALAALPGLPLGHLGEPSLAPASAWTAAGAVIRQLHEAPLPPWPGPTADRLTAELDAECEWMLANDVLPADVVNVNRRIAATAIGRPWTPAFIHGDLQVDHVFVADDEVTGILDWSGASQGDPMYDLATLTLGHPEHLSDVIAGYGADVDLGVISGWWSVRGLLGGRWLIEHGFDPNSPGCEFDVLRRQAK